MKEAGITIIFRGEGNSLIRKKLSITDTFSTSSAKKKISTSFSLQQHTKLLRGGIKMSIFQNVTISGTEGKYEIAGEARIETDEIQYSVEDGENFIDSGKIHIDNNNGDWVDFNFNISLPKDVLPVFGVLSLTLYEIKEDGEMVNEEGYTLDKLNEEEGI